jgi:predicted O-methyltransferase YrrM
LWAEAGVAVKIKLRLAPALGTLDELLSAGHVQQYDFIFIDADKPNYLNYYERSFQLLHPGGLIAVDNTLWGGSVADKENTEVDVQAIRCFNQTIFNDKPITLSLVPIGDGLTLARKRL